MKYLSSRNSHIFYMESLFSIVKILVSSEAIEQGVLNMHQKKSTITLKKITCEKFSGMMSATFILCSYKDSQAPKSSL